MHIRIHGTTPPLLQIREQIKCLLYFIGKNVYKITCKHRALYILKMLLSHYVIWEKPRNSAQKQISLPSLQAHIGIQNVL